MTDDATPSVEVMAEDLADLKAENEALAAQLKEAVDRVDGLIDVVARIQQDRADDDGTETGKDGKKEKGKGKDGKDDAPSAPPFILKLSGPVYDAELSALAFWVEHLLAPTYLNEITSQQVWCARWFNHPQAVARLHALWLAWQELTTPETGGYTGPSVWHRDHLRPCLEELRDPAGPFAACMTKPESRQHSELPVPEVDHVPYVAPPVVADAGTADAP